MQIGVPIKVIDFPDLVPEEEPILVPDWPQPAEKPVPAEVESDPKSSGLQGPGLPS